jgi:hypothetical protein
MIVSAGVITFGVVFTLLQVTRSEAAPGQSIGDVSPTLVAARAKSSLASNMVAGAVAVGVPITGSELLLRDVQPGDRLDVLASMPSPADGRPVTAVIVRGATVLEPATAGEPLLLEVSAPDAIALAHLVLGGTRLGYVVWSANGGSPPEIPPLDERTARSLLGLAPIVNQLQSQASASPTATAAPPATPTPIATLTPTPPSSTQARAGGFLYQVQPGDTWESIAGVFGLSVSELKHWNQTSADLDLAPRTLLFIPTS